MSLEWTTVNLRAQISNLINYMRKAQISR